MSSVRVLHVGKFYPPVSGGMEKVLQVICEGELGRVDGQVLVANDRPETVHEEINGVAVTRVSAWKKIGAVAICPALPYWMRRLSADVMVIHEPNPFALLAHALVRPRGRLILWMHAEVVRPQWKYALFYRPLLRRVLRLADRIVVATPPVKAQAHELRDFQDKCVVVPYAIEPDQHALTEEGRQKVLSVRKERSEPLILFVGRMVPYKGVDVLLRAMVGLQARAVLVGDGPMQAAWKELAGGLGVAERVRFAGEVGAADLAVLYHACDLFVLPSVTRAEAFGMVQLEAMACQKPVISTDLPSGVPWVNRHGDTGLVVPPGDENALRTAIESLLRDPDRRKAMGARGRARVLAQFSITRMIDQTTALYTDVIDAGGTAAHGALTHTAGA